MDEPERATCKVMMSRELMREFAARTLDGRRVVIDWGQPDTDGWYTPTFTTVEDDFYQAIQSLNIRPS